MILETGQASVSMLQRRLKLGYARAARLVDQLEEKGIVGPFEGSKPRQLLITKEQWQEMKYRQGVPGGTPPESASGAAPGGAEEDMPPSMWERPWTGRRRIHCKKGRGLKSAAFSCVLLFVVLSVQQPTKRHSHRVHQQIADAVHLVGENGGQDHKRRPNQRQGGETKRRKGRSSRAFFIKSR